MNKRRNKQGKNQVEGEGSRTTAQETSWKTAAQYDKILSKYERGIRKSV